MNFWTLTATVTFAAVFAGSYLVLSRHDAEPELNEVNPELLDAPEAADSSEPNAANTGAAQAAADADSGEAVQDPTRNDMPVDATGQSERQGAVYDESALDEPEANAGEETGQNVEATAPAVPEQPDQQ
jgi:hypothetical protein